ncbi:MAG: thiamine-phosphate kinase [Polyangiaceae bacterium]
MDERARVAMLARAFASRVPGVTVAIGDDAAVLDGSRGRSQVVWTIDEQVDGTHFRRDLVSWRSIGWRSFMAAASDVAAMGAEPWCALCALVLPDDVGDVELEQIALGQKEAAARAGAAVVGGNLARGTALSIATTLLGTCDRAVLRSGARVGDTLWLAGHVGLAAAGLRTLRMGKADDPRLKEAVTAWRTPQALVAEGLAMSRAAHAAIDVSDGLARDAGHLGEASGVRVIFDEDALRADDSLVRAAAALSEDPLVLALNGGEDYALVVASPEQIEGFRRIGQIVEGRGLSLRGPNGERAVEARGFDHFVR